MHHRVVARSLLAVVAAALVVVTPLPSVAGPFGTDCAQAAGTGVALVVDFGDVSGAGPRPGGVETRCVGHSSGLTGADALVAAGHHLRFGTSGLLCAIDGYPAEGCGERTGDRRYRYWSYWKGDAGTWAYAGNGPAVRLRDGAIDGWRFVEGAGSPADPQPRHAPDHGSICGGAPSPAPSSPASPGAPGAAGDPSPPTAPSTTATAPGADPSVPVPSIATDTAVPAPASADGSVTTAAPTGEVALDDVTPTSDARGTPGALGAVLLVVVIVGLGAAAALRTRRST